MKHFFLKTFTLTFIAFSVALMPGLVSAQVSGSKTSSGLIPCGNVVTDGSVSAGQECTFDDLILLAQNVINFLIFKIGAPIAAVMFAYAGFLWVTNAGNEGQITQAKGLFWAVFIGFVVMLAAWLTINMIVTFFLGPTYSFLGPSTP